MKAPNPTDIEVSSYPCTCGRDEVLIVDPSPIDWEDEDEDNQGLGLRGSYRYDNTCCHSISRVIFSDTSHLQRVIYSIQDTNKGGR